MIPLKRSSPQPTNQKAIRSWNAHPTETENFIIASVIDPSSTAVFESNKKRWWTTCRDRYLLIFIAATVVMTILRSSTLMEVFRAPSLPIRVQCVRQCGQQLACSVIVVPQLALVTVLLAAHFSPEPTLKRLALVRETGRYGPVLRLWQPTDWHAFWCRHWYFSGRKRNTSRNVGFQAAGEAGFTAQLT